MTTLRTFIAIELSSEAEAALANLQSRLKTATPPHSIRWTAPQNIHLTLHFLGDMRAEAVAQISDALASVAATAAPFTLTLGRLGCFPNTRRPRIIWTGVDGDMEPLLQLHRHLGEQLKAAINFSPETRPYSPHLTIGRVKNGIAARHLRQLSEALEQEQTQVGHLARLKVSEVSLMKSELKPAGAVYTRLYHGQLGGES